MKVTINGIEIEAPPKRNPFGSDYVYREVVKETKKAYLIQTHCFRFSNVTKFPESLLRICRMSLFMHIVADKLVLMRKAVCGI